MQPALLAGGFTMSARPRMRGGTGPLALWVGLAACLPWMSLAGCASTGSSARESLNYGLIGDTRTVWVRGPWEDIKPSSDADEVIDQLCPAIMRLPRASDRGYGQEYCGLIYSLNDMYYASHASPLGPTVLLYPEKRKQCYFPAQVRDARGRTAILSDYHSHPWFPSALSRDDRKAANLRWFLRIQFDTACTVMKLVPYLDEERPGEVYVREGSAWKLVGRIQPEDKASGIMTPVDE